MSDAEESARRRPTVGVGVVALNGPRVLLVRRAKPPREGEWSLPGGRQEWGETVAETARRELLEETGLTPSALHLLDVVDGILRTPGRGVTHHYTLIDFWTGIANSAAQTVRAGGDAAEVRWMSPEELDRLVDWGETRRLCRLALARRDGRQS